MTPLELLRGKLGDAVAGNGVIDLSRFLEVMTAVKNDYAILNNISGVDYLETDAKKAAKAGFDPHVEVVYHFSSFDQPGQRLQLKVILPRWKGDIAGELPEVPSVAHLWRTADWHEREVWDLAGIKFTDHPDLRRILLGDDWVGHPLRKDYEFPLEYHDIRCR